MSGVLGNILAMTEFSRNSEGAEENPQPPPVPHSNCENQPLNQFLMPSSVAQNSKLN